MDELSLLGGNFDIRKNWVVITFIPCFREKDLQECAPRNETDQFINKLVRNQRRDCVLEVTDGREELGEEGIDDEWAGAMAENMAASDGQLSNLQKLSRNNSGYT